MVVDVNNKTAFDPLNKQVQITFGPASILKRVLAFLLDLLIINWVIASSFRNIILEGYFLSGSKVLLPQIVISLYFICFMMFLYFVIFEKVFSQTPGKMIFGLYVMSTKIVDKSLEKPTLLEIVLRNLHTLVLFPFTLLLLIDPINIFLNLNRQRLLEKLSNTIVIERYEL